MIPDIEEQLEQLFDQVGLNTKDIRHNSTTGRWMVDPQVEGSDERFREYKSEIGAGKSVDYGLDFKVVRTVVPEIDGAAIPAGTVKFHQFNSSELLLEVE